MITIRAGSSVIGVSLLLLIVGCSREQQDWRAAESADTTEAYDRFIEHHPESELIRQARTRIAQLGEDHDWQRAGSADTADAYREFIGQHPNGKWTQEARIRMESFSLGEHTGTGPVGPGTARPQTAAATNAVGPDPERSAGSAAPGHAGGESLAGSTGAVAYGIDGAPVRSSGVAAVVNDAPPVGSGAIVPAAPATGGFGIQLGAFSSEAGADGQWRALSAHFGPDLQGLQQHIVAADTASGRVYRLQATVGSESRARAICDSLHKQAQACVAVLPH